MALMAEDPEVEDVGITMKVGEDGLAWGELGNVPRHTVPGGVALLQRSGKVRSVGSSTGLSKGQG